MTLLVGIDEAGYGPHLGPLVVAAAAIEFPGREPPDPNLWGSLRGHVRKRPAGTSSRVVVCDSKVAYARPQGLGTLERSVLGFLAAGGMRPGTLAELLDASCSGSDAAEERTEDIASVPWHRPESLTLPVAAGPDAVPTAADHFAKALEGVGGRVGGLRINVAPAARLNRLIDEGGRNKAAALFALTADLLAQIWADVCRKHPSDRDDRTGSVHVTMDQHGGRRYYADLLAGVFPMGHVETIEEAPTMSRYRLQPSGPTRPPQTGRAHLHLTVHPRCERWSFPVALASMAAKYVRELHMRQFNAYFRLLVPNLKPTAGYGRDAWRFLAEVEAARAAVPRGAMLRSR
ncbi:MAG TPA: hypothetical protein VM219_02125 [Phycisphaerae bacterium]|nr:hypothetical protein [Phycisphaerae bacterium]